MFITYLSNPYFKIDYSPTARVKSFCVFSVCVARKRCPRVSLARASLQLEDSAAVLLGAVAALADIRRRPGATPSTVRRLAL